MHGSGNGCEYEFVLQIRTHTHTNKLFVVVPFPYFFSHWEKWRASTARRAARPPTAATCARWLMRLRRDTEHSSGLPAGRRCMRSLPCSLPARRNRRWSRLRLISRQVCRPCRRSRGRLRWRFRPLAACTAACTILTCSQGEAQREEEEEGPNQPQVGELLGRLAGHRSALSAWSRFLSTQLRADNDALLAPYQRSEVDGASVQPEQAEQAGIGSFDTNAWPSQDSLVERQRASQPPWRCCRAARRSL